MDSNSEENVSKPLNQFPGKIQKIMNFLLKSVNPTFTWQSTIILYFTLGLCAIIYGLLISKLNSESIEHKIRYDSICGSNIDCKVPITIDETMKQPVFIYYRLDNFYQNHRLYIESFDAAQLRGETIDYAKANSSCFPAVTNADLGVTKSWDNIDLDPTAIASPCGLIAKSYFSDSYTVADESGNDIPINQKDIAWPNESGSKYKKSADSANIQWTNPESEHFIVWMKIATYPNFRKLWGKVEKDLEKGKTYTIDIKNTYDVNKFDGKKYIILATTNMFGGKSYFLSFTFFTIGVLFLFIAIFFAAKSKYV